MMVFRSKVLAVERNEKNWKRVIKMILFTLIYDRVYHFILVEKLRLVGFSQLEVHVTIYFNEIRLWKLVLLLLNWFVDTVVYHLKIAICCYICYLFIDNLHSRIVFVRNVYFMLRILIILLYLNLLLSIGISSVILKVFLNYMILKIKV